MSLNARLPAIPTVPRPCSAPDTQTTTQLTTLDLNASIAHLHLCVFWQDGETAAHVATYMGEPDIGERDCLELLIDAKCDLNITDVSRECIRRAHVSS